MSKSKQGRVLRCENVCLVSECDARYNGCFKEACGPCTIVCARVSHCVSAQNKSAIQFVSKRTDQDEN